MKNNTTRFATFASQTIAFETGGDKSGAYHLDPKDAGGETKWGISKRAHPNENIKSLTFSDALRIYNTQYWNNLYEHIYNDALAFKVFDMGVLSGKNQAVKTLQKAIISEGLLVRVDGILGPLTLVATNNIDSERLYNKYVELYTKYFKRICWLRPSNKKFLKGWLRRLNWKWGEK